MHATCRGRLRGIGRRSGVRITPGSAGVSPVSRGALPISGQAMRRASYEKLVVWQRAMELVAFVYKMTDSFPDHEKSGLTAAVKKAVYALPGKIAQADQAADAGGAIKAIESAQDMLVELYNQALIARRVKVMRRRPLMQLRARCRKLDALLERDRERIEAIVAEDDAEREAPPDHEGAAPPDVVIPGPHQLPRITDAA